MTDRLDLIIEHFGLSAAEFARSIGMSPSMVTEIRKGRAQHLSGQTLLSIAEKYNVNVHWLVTGEGLPFIETQEAISVKPLTGPLDDLGSRERKVVEELIAVLAKGDARPLGRGKSGESYSHAELREIGLVASVAAGNPMEAIEHPEEVYLLPRKMFKQKGKLFLLKVRGDSMIGAGIFDGDLAVMERVEDAEQLRSGAIVAISLDGAATLKRFLRDNGSIVLRAENSAYPDRVVTAREFPVLWGRFVGLVRREGE